MKRLVTISREYGSGGRIIGKLLAEKLNVPFYDKEIIEIAAQNMRLESMGYHVMDEIEARLTEIKRAKNEAKKNETN